MKPLMRIAVGAAVVAPILWGCREPAPPPMYQVATTTVRDIVVSARAEGVLEPIQTVEVKSKASGEITEVAVETGDSVSRGDLMVRVDQRVPRNALVQAEADLNVARAQLENAKSQLARATALYEAQSITQTEFEAANLAHANANAELVRGQRAVEDARISFEDTEVRAPGRGIVLEKNVEVGTVIASASRDLGGGAVLLRMANLDTVQIRALVDETDIGKIQPGMAVTIEVDAYPTRPFNGRVLTIEPEAVVNQNVTAFPVLVRIPNPGVLLRPGMNADVEIHVGRRNGVVAIPNAALRTPGDVFAAAQVLGLDMDTVNEQLAARAEPDDRAESVALGNGTVSTVAFRGQQVTLPEGLTPGEVQPVLDKVQSGGPQAFQTLTDGERAIMRQLRGVLGGGPGRGGAGNRAPATDFEFGGQYIVFAMAQGAPRAIPVRTGLTDLDYSEIVDGLAEGDTILVLPSASLVQSQQEFQERMQRFNRGIPGVQRSN